MEKSQNKYTSIGKNNTYDKNLTSLNERNVDWFYSIQRSFKDGKSQKTINDGLWLLLWEEKDQLLYNKEALWLTKKQGKRRWENILKTTRNNIADVLVWADFKKPWHNISIIQWDFFENKNQKNSWVYNIWYTDTLLVDNPFKDSKAKSVVLWGAVWDCPAISSFYKEGKKEVMWLTHAWYAGLKNQVVEQLIDAYKTLVWRDKINEIFFDISPLAGINYEFEEKLLLKLFKDTFEKYDIDYIQDSIYKLNEKNKSRWYFIIWKLLERIFLENWIEKEQLNFHQDYTTSYNNKWPSYRLHTLSTQWLFNWKIIPNSRMWIFNIIRK